MAGSMLRSRLGDAKAATDDPHLGSLSLIGHARISLKLHG